MKDFLWLTLETYLCYRVVIVICVP